MSPVKGVQGPDRGFDRYDRRAEEISGISEPTSIADKVALAGIANALHEADQNQADPDFGKFEDRIQEDYR